MINFNKLLVCNSREFICQTLDITNEDFGKLISQNYRYKKLPVIFVNEFYTKNDIGFYNRKFENENFTNIKIDKFNLTLFGDISYEFNKKLRKLTIIKNSLQARALINNNSILENINIEFFDNSLKSNISETKKYLIDKNGLTGCLTIYDSILKNLNINATNSNCEDAINIVRSEGNLNNVEIKDSISDAFDADFSYIDVNNFKIENAGNDCIDFSGGSYNLYNLTLNNCSDKGLSAENSTILVNNIKISNSLYGIASKDFSNVNIKKILLEKVAICWDAYSKKQEFGGGKITINNYQSKSLCEPRENIDERSKIEFGNVF